MILVDQLMTVDGTLTDHYSMDATYDSMEGVCRAKDRKCFDTQPTLTDSADPS